MVDTLLPVSVQAAEVRRRGKRLLGPVDVTLDGRGLTVVLGPNGAGKTTFLRMLHGLERLSAGRVTWDAPLDIAMRGQAFVFQTPIVLRRSVLENVAYPLVIRGMRKADAMDKTRSILATVGLADLAEMPATRISGGEKQKLALARALITDPKVLFLDEPCSSLDGTATKDIEAVLSTVVAQGMRVIMSSHDLGQARRLADEVLFFVNGKVNSFADAGAFFGAPETPEATAFLRGDIVE